MPKHPPTEGIAYVPQTLGEMHLSTIYRKLKKHKFQAKDLSGENS
jgi:hypothetical protein